MIGSSLILNNDVARPSVLPDVDAAKEASPLKQQQAAKDFESVFIERLFSAMQSTVQDWGLEKDGTSKQIDGIFWSYLARGVADQGGFGLWKDISGSLDRPEAATKAAGPSG